MAACIDCCCDCWYWLLTAVICVALVAFLQTFLCSVVIQIRTRTIIHPLLSTLPRASVVLGSTPFPSPKYAQYTFGTGESICRTLPAYIPFPSPKYAQYTYGTDESIWWYFLPHAYLPSTHPTPLSRLYGVRLLFLLSATGCSTIIVA